jgi:hypothetical protein
MVDKLFLKEIFFLAHFPRHKKNQDIVIIFVDSDE